MKLFIVTIQRDYYELEIDKIYTTIKQAELRIEEITHEIVNIDWSSAVFRVDDMVYNIVERNLELNELR